MKRISLWTRLLLIGAMLAGARGAWAHEDEGPPMDPTIISPGLKLLGIVLAVAIGVTVWYQLRKRAMLRGDRDDRRD
jgi:hypothetical protein